MTGTPVTVEGTATGSRRLAQRHTLPERRFLVLAGGCGLAAVGLYVAATVLGGVLHPGYDHVRQAISELTASQAPYRVPLAALYVGYNVLLTGFAVAVARAWPRSRLLRVAVVLFAVAAVSGIGQVTVFPQDSTGAPATATGAGHVVLAGISALLAVVCAVMYGVAFRRMRWWPQVSVPSFVVAAFLLVIGPVTAASVGGPWMGLFERLTIGAFLAWVCVVSVSALTKQPAPSPLNPGVEATRAQ